MYKNKIKLNRERTVYHRQDGSSFEGEMYTGQVNGQPVSIKREYETLTPRGNLMNGRWVLRIAGEMVDFDCYRNDLAERNGYNLY